MKTKIFDQIRKKLKSVKTAIIAAHVDPDGDAIGSSLALAMLLEKMRIKATVYSKDNVPEIYNFLPRSGEVVSRLPLGARFDVAFMLDASDICRAGDKINIRELAKVLINIDHHPDNQKYGDINYVEKMSSVGEQIYQLAKYFKVKIDKNMAVCLYVAMITDTGNFRYENTSIATFLMAADLLKQGVDTHSITSLIYDNKSVSSIRLRAMAMQQLQFACDGKIGLTVVDDAMMQKAGAKNEELTGLIDLIRSVQGVEVAILFRVDGDKIKINFRSKQNVNVGEIAKSFGGGGHVKAAGAVLNGSLADVKAKVLSIVCSKLATFA
ncbi:MAG: bifunctional oligoribonuclease/PAP phosphatase NrnA [Candidatus Margulisiibacteriota bacterium]